MVVREAVAEAVAEAAVVAATNYLDSGNPALSPRAEHRADSFASV